MANHRRSGLLAWRVLVSAAVVGGVGGVGVARGDVFIGTVAGKVSFSVPNPSYNPAVPAGPGNEPCVTVEYGELGGRLGRRDNGSMAMAAAFRKTYTGPECCPRLDVLNLVVGDSTPPYWVDPQGGIHRIDEVTGPEGLYVDPLSGGNGRPGGGVGEGDRGPGYDGVRRTRDDGTARHASDAGNGVAGYGLNNVNQNGVNWTTDPAVTFTLSDNPSRVVSGAVLEFITIVVCIDDAEHHICPVGGFAWGQRADGTQHIDGPFSGANYPGGLTSAMVTAGLARSGFGDYSMQDSCCPCPAPGGAVLAGVGFILGGTRRRRRDRAPRAA